MFLAWPLRLPFLGLEEFPEQKEVRMFRKPRVLWMASLCGLVAAVVFFVIGLVHTVRFNRWNPYMTINWDEFLASVSPNFGADFFLHSFVFLIALVALVFLLALGSRTYQLHPTSTVTGVGFLGMAMVVVAVYNIWLAFGQDMVLLRYRSTQDQALRQTFQHLYQAGFLDTPVISAVVAYFAIPGFVFLGMAFWGRKDGWLSMWPWCWVTAAVLLCSMMTLGYGYERTFAANQFPRSLMMWSHVGLWLLPTITMALCAFWLQREETIAREKPSAEAPPLEKAA